MASTSQRQPIWWSNAIFFCSMHVVGVLGGWLVRPFSQIPISTKLLCLASWQLASFGITVGYHRLWSHRSYTARRSLRVVLAIMGSLGFQGSIKWWCMRHRLHHRYTDDPIHDPYSATRGLFFSHMGWIFVKPTYERLKLVDKEDLEADEVVRMQHRYYVPIALFFGLIMPTVIGALWGDALGGFIWGGVVARLLIWHCTFMINSLAHWEGLQPYTDEVTARGNFLLAIFTSGEGNHNFHAFPHDFRAGYNALDWDPSKWIIYVLHRYTNLVTSVKCAKDEDVLRAASYMKGRNVHHHHYPVHVFDGDDDSGVDGLSSGSISPKEEDVWGRERVEEYVQSRKGKPVLLVIDGWLVDASEYAKEHPGGATLMRKHAYGNDDASWAFHGGLNNHSRSARTKMTSLRIARVRLA